ncbi:MAG TPA: sigma-70 family RNA polymerase sigma factor [Gemmataceae bacterium]|jgi:RNA polymerase sigma-70 factor (ECF subfamily)|nr:sigma-70 family RNA polymerase sigma factor [Gemmataceae bacterium]
MTTPADEPSDGSLLRRLHAGTADAATLLYFRYADHLLSLAAARLPADLGARVGPDDIVQSVFRTFFRRAALGQFEVPAGADLWKLFLVIALNKIRSAGIHHRADRRDVGRTPALDAAAEAGLSDGRRADALTALRLVIEDLLGGLSAQQRQIVERRIDGYEVAEIAGLCGCSKRTVERCLQTFRDRLHAQVDED